MTKYKIAIATPHQADFRDIVMDAMYKEIESAKTWQMGHYHKIEGGSCISSLRCQLAKKFLDTNDDFLLFMDSDMLILESGSLNKLLETSEKYSHFAITAGLFGKKYSPFQPTYLPLMESDKRKIKAGEVLEKESVGMAFTLIPRQVMINTFNLCEELNKEMKEIPARYQRMEQPFQPFIYKGKYTGEDRAFCIRAGFMESKTLIDTRVIIGHIGDCVFTPQMWIERGGETENE